MSETPEPVAGKAPSKLSFAEAKDDDDHLRPRLVALIVVVIVLIAAGITAAVVFTKKPAVTTPPQPGGQPGQIVSMPAASVTPHGMPIPVALMSMGKPLAGQTVLAVGSTVTVNGVSLTPAAGWTADQKNASVMLMNKDQSAIFFMTAGVSDSKDAAEVLKTDMQKWMGQDYSNVKTTKPKADTLNSEVFQEMVAVGYTGDYTSQQGTMSVTGIFVELMNTSTGNSAFVVYEAISQDAYDKSSTDADAMISSML